jgi:PAS domain S-box-containing protein
MSDQNSNSEESVADSLISVDDPAVQVLGATLQVLPDALYIFDHNRRLILFNRAGAVLQNLPEEALRDRRCCEMFWRADDAENCLVERVLESAGKVEVEMLAGENGDQPTLLIAQPLMQSPQPAVFVLARDISELRQAEAEALEHKSFMSSVADRTPDEIYALDRQGRITWMNERAEKDQLLMLAGHYFSEFIAAESRDLTIRNLQLTLAGEETQFEVRAVRTDGTVREVEAYTSPLWKDGEVTGVLVFSRDVTERKRTQELMAQSDKLRAVGELAAGVAHNLNNSLTVIKGRAQLMLMRSKDESTTKNLQVITDAVEDGAKTLRRILEFARRDAPQGYAPVDLGELISSSIEIARPKWQSKTARENGREIKVQIDSRGPVYVMAELAELREVVLNLIFNAVDAMPDGGTMEVGSRAELDSGCFWVADSGCGMSPETIARIFEPFYTTKGEKGTGLGLSASHGIITRHHGEIMVVSEPGEGTRFEVRFPLCEEKARFIKISGDAPAQEIGEEPNPNAINEDIMVPI